MDVMQYGNNASVHYGYNTLDKLTAKRYINGEASDEVYYFFDYMGRIARIRDMFADVNEEYVYNVLG